jgi:hypothetical protein
MPIPNTETEIENKVSIEKHETKIEKNICNFGERVSSKEISICNTFKVSWTKKL